MAWWSNLVRSRRRLRTPQPPAPAADGSCAPLAGEVGIPAPRETVARADGRAGAKLGIPAQRDRRATATS